jgi:hypothetical protein
VDLRVPAEPAPTNTGRRDYSGTPYPYQMRRHHLVFAVDGTGKTIEEWLQHDKYSRRREAPGWGEWAADRTRS